MRFKNNNRKIPDTVIVFLITLAAVLGWAVLIGTILLNLMIRFPHGL